MIVKYCEDLKNITRTKQFDNFDKNIMKTPSDIRPFLKPKTIKIVCKSFLLLNFFWTFNFYYFLNNLKIISIVYALAIFCVLKILLQFLGYDDKAYNEKTIRTYIECPRQV